jgi:hypothetical protein
MMSKKADRFSEQSHELHRAVKGVAELFGLSLVKEESGVYGLEVLLQNNVAGVKFEFSPQEGSGWRAVVGRLSEGQFPTHPIRIDRHTALHRFDLRDIAALRIELIPEMAGRINTLAPLSASEMSVLLERCCADLLKGDFSLSARLRERVMSRLPASAADWAAAGSIDTDLSFLSFLELYRTDVAERRMPARRVVEPLDVVEHIGPRLLSRPVHLPGRALGLQ